MQIIHPHDLLMQHYVSSCRIYAATWKVLQQVVPTTGDGGFWLVDVFPFPLIKQVLIFRLQCQRFCRSQDWRGEKWTIMRCFHLRLLVPSKWNSFHGLWLSRIHTFFLATHVKTLDIRSGGDLQALVYRFLSLVVKTERGSETLLSTQHGVCVFGSCCIYEQLWTPAFMAHVLRHYCTMLLLDV